MTYRPPAVREARDLTDALYDAALALDKAGFTFGLHGTSSNAQVYQAQIAALVVARNKLHDHLDRMVKS